MNKKLLLVFFFIIIALFRPSLALGQAGGCTSKFPVTANGATQSLLYCSNKSIDTQDPSVKRLIIVVHGDGRNAGSYFSSMVKAANGAGSKDSLIISPHFATRSDVSASDVLTWTSTGWKQGDISDSTVKVSTYTVVDNLIKHIADRNKFPNLKMIIFTGFSGGGQMTSRYGPGNQAETQLAGAGYSFRYIIASPSNYLYLSPERPKGDQFAVPTTCPTYDNYKYGLQKMTPYMADVGAQKIKTQFGQRNIGIFIGGADTGTADSSCPAVIQGSGRLQKAQAYYKYFSHLLGQASKNFIVTVPGVGHNSSTLYASSLARPYLFDDFASMSESPTVLPPQITSSPSVSTATLPTPSLVAPSLYCLGSCQPIAPLPTDSPSVSTGTSTQPFGQFPGLMELIQRIIELIRQSF